MALHILNRLPTHQFATPLPQQANVDEDDFFAKIELLAELRQKGILSDNEFTDKKAELLSRL